MTDVHIPQDRPTIMVVEDLPDNLFVLKETLERGGYNVIAAENGEKALELLDTCNDVIDLILSDIMMPKMSGYTLCEYIRTDKNRAEIPVILITSYKVEEKDAIQGMKAGADDYLTRPIHPDLLIEKIERIITKRKQISHLLDVCKEKSDTLESHEWSIRMLVHDLRNPLTSALGYLSLLALDKDITERQARFIQKIQAAINKQAEMLQDLLAIAAAKEGRLVLSKEVFSLCDCVREHMLLQHGSAVSRKVAFHFECFNKEMKVNADRNLLGRVISNLLINAVKYSTSGSMIEVFTGMHDDIPMLSQISPQPQTAQKAWFVISNEGDPIPLAEQAKIFHPFERSAQSKNEEDYAKKGIGLGLCFCEQVIKLHEGKIGVVSPVPGKNDGVMFYFSLP